MSHYNPANDPAVTKGIQEAYGFKRGDIVEYTNPQGVIFGPHIVVGFVQNPDPDFRPNATVYIDFDAPWFSVEPSSLTKCEEGFDGCGQRINGRYVTTIQERGGFTLGKSGS
jgi:hypothetical protein